jgi:hypothetical protein
MKLYLLRISVPLLLCVSCGADKSNEARVRLVAAINEFEEHIAKIDDFELGLNDFDAEREESVELYFSRWEEWFEEKLLARAKLNTEGGMGVESDRLEGMIAESLMKFYVAAKSKFSNNPEMISRVERMLMRRGYGRDIERIQKESEQ